MEKLIKKKISMTKFMNDFEKLTEECEKERENREASSVADEETKRPKKDVEILRVARIVTRGNKDVAVDLFMDLWQYFRNKPWHFKDIWYQAKHRVGSHMRNLVARVNSGITSEAKIIEKQLRKDYTNKRRFYRYERLLELHGGVIHEIEK